MNDDKPRYKYHINSPFQAEPLMYYKDNFANDLQRISFAKRTLGKFVRDNFADAYIAVELFNDFRKIIDFTVERELFEINCECGMQYMWIHVQICDSNGEYVFSNSLNTQSQTEAINFIKKILAEYNLLSDHTMKTTDNTAKPDNQAEHSDTELEIGI